MSYVLLQTVPALVLRHLPLNAVHQNLMRLLPRLLSYNQCLTFWNPDKHLHPVLPLPEQVFLYRLGDRLWYDYFPVSPFSAVQSPEVPQSRKNPHNKPLFPPSGL